MSKFAGITFPFYGITEVPIEIKYGLTKINIWTLIILIG